MHIQEGVLPFMQNGHLKLGRWQDTTNRRCNRRTPAPSRDSSPLQPPARLPDSAQARRICLTSQTRHSTVYLSGTTPLAVHTRAGAHSRRRKSGTRDQVTALARWRGSLEVLRHSTGWRRRLRSQVLSASPRGTSGVRQCSQQGDRKGLGALAVARGARAARGQWLARAKPRALHVRTPPPSFAGC